jgi:hypothetical protein
VALRKCIRIPRQDPRRILTQAGGLLNLQQELLSILRVSTKCSCKYVLVLQVDFCSEFAYYIIVLLYNIFIYVIIYLIIFFSHMCI